MTTTTINIKYQIVIPKIIRKNIKLEPGEELAISHINKDTIILKKFNNSMRELRGSIDFPTNYAIQW